MKLSIYFILAGLFILQVLFYGIFNSKNLSAHVNNQIISSPTPTSLPTLTPTITPTPTPVYTGYCLHVPVIFYHHIEPGAEANEKKHTSLYTDVNIFEQQMQYLSSHGYTSIKAEDLVNALSSHQGLPNKAIVVSIDDGYDDIYRYAYPIARKYGIILNLMIPTGLMENPGFMSWANLKDMVGSGSVFIYNHTWSHSSLPRDDDAKAIMEFTTAQKQITDHFGHTAPIIAYPYGSANSRIVSLLVKNGFIGGFTTIPGSVQCDSFIMNLHRIRIGNAPLSYYGF